MPKIAEKNIVRLDVDEVAMLLDEVEFMKNYLLDSKSIMSVQKLVI